MKLPDIYSYGTLFGFSGLDGENVKDEDFIGMTMPKPVTLRFESSSPVSLYIPAKNDRFCFILSDIIKTDKTLIIFTDNSCIVGRSEEAPAVFTGTKKIVAGDGETNILENDGFCYALSRSAAVFALCRSRDAAAACERSRVLLAADLEKLIEEKLDYYRKLPPCPRPGFEKLYYKCLSVNKVNVYSPQNGISHRFTTPDRLPHKHMWLWDSMFHAMAFSRYDPETAKDAILAVLECQRDDGFIPHMIRSRDDTSAITQPQVIAWAVLDVCERTSDKDFLVKTKDAVAAYLLWFLKNRDLNSNGLLEWETDFSNERCRCDESGMDNSPRFDTRDRLDAIDSSCFMVHDCSCMAKIYELTGEEDNAAKFREIAKNVAGKINELLWDGELGAYTDRAFSGRLTGVLSVCSFLPLFANVATPQRADRLVKLLTDEKRFRTPLPVPSVSRDNADYGTDMWRGAVWLNYNYMIMLGLRNYGFYDVADRLKEKTLNAVLRRFEETGSVFEFYDPEDKTVPWKMNRKGEQPDPPDYRIKVHSITDYNWSACFTLLMLQEDQEEK